MEELKIAAKKITELEIQGATNIALYAVKEFIKFVKRYSKNDRRELWKIILKGERILTESRSTEPAMRNGLRYIIGKLRKDEQHGIEDTNLDQMVEIYGIEYENILKQAKRRIAKYGARLIPDNAPKRFVVQTHCHSSIVEAILIEAARQGKNFEVINTETRPFNQGRITSRILTEHGIKVTHVVDSAMRWAARNLGSDLIMVGADAVTSEGTVLNKIGTRLLALVASEEHIPMYTATPLLKYNPNTAFGNYEKIEMRDTYEIWKDWEDKPEEVRFLNPAFETVNRLHLSGLITEAGIFPSSEVHIAFMNTYPFLFDIYNELENQELGEFSI